MPIRLATLLLILAPLATWTAIGHGAEQAAGNPAAPGQSIVLNGDRRENSRLLSQAVAAESRRTDVLAARVEHIETLLSEHPAPLFSRAWFAHLGASILEKMLADAVGFAIFAIVLSLILKHELIRTVKEGLKSIGTIFADSFVDNVIPEIANFRRDAITVLQTRSFFYEQATDISAPAAIDAEIHRIEAQLPSAGLTWTESQLIALGEKFPGEFKIVARLYQLYLNAAAADGGVESARLNRRAIRFLEERAAAFADQTDYYYFVAQAHCRLSDSDPAGHHYRAALRAANEAIRLEPDNPRWLSLRGLVHDTFGWPGDAVPDTEQALALAEKQHDAPNIARAHNNLAYYLAELRQGQNKARALEFARAACEYDRQNGLPEHISLDTLGYVLLRFAASRSELEEAVDALGRAHLGDPHDSEIKFNLNEARKMLEALGSEASTG